jgi:peptidyl-dipeptidase Dcp
MPALAADQPDDSDNPLLTESTLPLQYPPFDRLRDTHFQPAIERGMAERLAEIEAIANNPAAPSFDNTIVAMERAGRLLSRASVAFFGLNAANTNPQLQQIGRTLAPLRAAHFDAVLLHPKLFARIDSLYQARATLGLDGESQRLLWRYHQDFVRAGARLSDADKARLRALNGELATLQTRFTQNVLKERAAASLLVDKREDLAGLSDAEINSAAAAARAAGHAQGFLLVLGNTSGQAPLTDLRSPATRARLMAASLARGGRGGEFDNQAVVLDIARKRAERAALLGYAHHAAFELAEQTIGGVDVLNRLLAQLAPTAVANARREQAQMQAIADAERAGLTVGAADWALYSEKLRAERYAYDESQLKPYFELNNVLVDGVFFAAGKLYGLQFKERRDLPVYEPSVRVFDVLEADGKQLAIFLFDPYARANKNGGAWANSYVGQDALRGTRPVVANHLNIPKPPAGEPTLLTLDEVITTFHEFGHALHAMFSAVKFPRLQGTPRDFVEYPSQVNEMWVLWPEVLKNYARHHKTGAPLPQALVDKVTAATKFNQGFLTTEYLAATLLDQAWHQAGVRDLPAGTDVLAFEAAALKRLGVDVAAVPPRYRSTYFSHSFAGGYAAGYYSYLWSEVLDADSVDWFKQHGGLTRANGERFRKTVLSRGGSDDALQLFRDFTGGEPDLQPLLRRRGLDAASAAKP